MLFTYNQDVVDRARHLNSEGRTSEAWALLGSNGDNYANRASKITGDFDPLSPKKGFDPFISMTVIANLVKQSFFLSEQHCARLG